MLVVIPDPILSSAIIIGSFIVLDFKLIVTYVTEGSILLETLATWAGISWYVGSCPADERLLGSNVLSNILTFLLRENQLKATSAVIQENPT